MSIKWKLLMCFGIFTAIIIALLWLFQTVFLDDFYKVVKEREVKQAASTITERLSKDNLERTIAGLSYKGELNISIYATSGKHILTFLGRKDIPTINLLPLFIEAKKNPGQDIIGYNVNAAENSNFASTNLDNMTLVKMSKDYFIVVNSLLVPVAATESTLKIQLIMITGLLIFVAVFMAVFLSKTISNPIIKINQSAKVLATGDYNVVFNGEGYKEIKELSATLNYATKELSKVDNLRSELIANISHDLRTPLTMITGYSEVMRDLPGENTPENVQIIIDEAKRLTSLVNDVLDISKIESGNMVTHFEEINITKTINGIVERYKKLTDNNFVFEYQTELFVNADELQITQVLYNLLNNAVTHTGEDKNIVIRQSLINDVLGNITTSAVKIEVIDTGCGIPNEQLPYIWDRYYKVDKTHKRAIIGTGLGLSIVRSILEIHKGKYGVVSDDSGSTFWFSMKAEEPKNHAAKNN